MKQGVQDEIAMIGNEGCYALALVRVAELSDGAIIGFDTAAADAVADVLTGVRDGFIKSDMTVLDAAGFLKHLTGLDWTKEYKDSGYEPKEGDYLLAEWFNKRTGKTHFTLAFPEKWDGLKDSVTVKEGVVRSYRLCRIAKTR
jgi:hypothetical protein